VLAAAIPRGAAGHVTAAPAERIARQAEPIAAPPPPRSPQAQSSSTGDEKCEEAAAPAGVRLSPPTAVAGIRLAAGPRLTWRDAALPAVVRAAERPMAVGLLRV
jgi:hypothetical protein